MERVIHFGTVAATVAFGLWFGGPQSIDGRDLNDRVGSAPCNGHKVDTPDCPLGCTGKYRVLDTSKLDLLFKMVPPGSVYFCTDPGCTKIDAMWYKTGSTTCDPPS